MAIRYTRARWTLAFRRLLAISVLLIGCLAGSSSIAAAQSIRIEVEQTITRTIEGATAAFSLDPCVSAEAQAGTVTIAGRAAGSTHVIVVIGNRTESLEVTVTDPPSAAVVPQSQREIAAADGGSYEVRYGTSPAAIQSMLRLTRVSGQRTTALSLGATLLETDRAPFGLPLASYSIRSDRREITVLDRMVTNSPMTISHSNVRGLHVREGPLQVHAGYSFFSAFEHVLLPSNKEAVVGVSYRQRLTPSSTLTPNVYYFGSESSLNRSGPLATLLYESSPRKDVTLLGELAVSTTVGGAMQLKVDKPHQHFMTRVRLAPERLPSLTTDQPAGQLIEAQWTQDHAKLDVSANVTSQRYTQGPIEQASHLAHLQLRYQLTRDLALHGGPGLSTFDTASPRDSTISSITLPVGLSLQRGPIGYSLDYQFSRETRRDLAGHLLRGGIHRAVGRGIHLSASGERQTHAPTAGHILATVPWIQQTLDRLGITANTPAELAHLFRTNAELATLGYANDLVLDVTPTRTRVTANAGWSGGGTSRPQLLADAVFNRDERVDRTSHSAVQTVSYSQKIGPATDVFVTWSRLCGGYMRTSSSCRPVMSAALRRAVGRTPGILFPQRRGEIRGSVFRDDERVGVYAPGMSPVAGIEVVLDGTRYTRTDSNGFYRFEGVPEGRHQVEVRRLPEGPFFFTTPSPVEVQTDTTVNFGITFSLGRLRVSVRNDAGATLSGIVVRAASEGRHFTARSTGDGSVAFDGVPTASYTVTIDPESLPAGYALDELAPQEIAADPEAPSESRFVLRAYRSVGGHLRLFNRVTGRYAPLPNALVEIPALNVRTTSDSSGSYILRDIPAGEFAVTAVHQGERFTTRVTVPGGPASLKNVDVAIVPAVSTHEGAGRLDAVVPETRFAVTILAPIERLVSFGARLDLPEADQGTQPLVVDPDQRSLAPADTSSSRHRGKNNRSGNRAFFPLLFTAPVLGAGGALDAISRERHPIGDVPKGVHSRSAVSISGHFVARRAGTADARRPASVPAVNVTKAKLEGLPKRTTVRSTRGVRPPLSPGVRKPGSGARHLSSLQPSLEQRQEYQQLFFSGFAFDGNGFIQTAVTAPAFECLRSIERENESLMHHRARTAHPRESQSRAGVSRSRCSTQDRNLYRLLDRSFLARMSVLARTPRYGRIVYSASPPF